MLVDRGHGSDEMSSDDYMSNVLMARFAKSGETTRAVKALCLAKVKWLVIALGRAVREEVGGGGEGCGCDGRQSQREEALP